MRVEFALPLPSRGNARGRSIAQTRRTALQRSAARLAVQGSGETIELPVRVVMTRVSARLLDFVNLCMALKAVQDGIADAFGVTDSPKETRVTWVFEQEQRKGMGGAQRVRIEVTSCR